MCPVMDAHWPDGARRVFGVYLYLTHLPRKRVNIGMDATDAIDGVKERM